MNECLYLLVSLGCSNIATVWALRNANTTSLLAALLARLKKTLVSLP